MIDVIIRRVSRGAEFIAAMALMVIFVTFILQIFSRYAPKMAWAMPIPALSDWMGGLEPIGWTVNLISLMWVWLIFFGCAFFVRERDHVAFDVFYQAARPKLRRMMALASAALIIGIMVYSFVPTWEAIFGNRLMELKKIQTLRLPITGGKIPVKWLFASYILLMMAVIIRYGWRFWLLTRYRLGEQRDDSAVSSARRDAGGVQDVADEH